MNINNNINIKLYDLGIKSYKLIWNFQEKLMNKIINLKLFNKNAFENKKKIYNYLLFVEHDNVYTIGKNGNIKNLLKQSFFM